LPTGSIGGRRHACEARLQAAALSSNSTSATSPGAAGAPVPGHRRDGQSGHPVRCPPLRRAPPVFFSDRISPSSTGRCRNRTGVAVVDPEMTRHRWPHRAALETASMGQRASGGVTVPPRWGQRWRISTVIAALARLVPVVVKGVPTRPISPSGPRMRPSGAMVTSSCLPVVGVTST